VSVGAEAEYARLVERARGDESVLGLILTGSRGRSFRVRPDSDYDVRLIVRDDAVSDYGTPRGSPIEVVVLREASFARAALPGSGSEWDRYSYVRCQLVLDKTVGSLARTLEAKARLSGAEAAALAPEALDDYVNSFYRSARNHENGLLIEARLDAAESVPPLLTMLFALHRRVRPFNKFLGWELRQEPLEGEEWSADVLLPRLQRILGPGELVAQQRLFVDVERLARERGLGHVVDGWQPDLAWLRGAPAA
jgi:hypothetical protein